MSHSIENEQLFNQLKSLMTEQRNPGTTGIDLADPLEIVSLINREDAGIAGSVKEKLPEIASAVEAVRLAVEQGGRLLYFGAGTSGRLGVLDATECPPTFGTDPGIVQGFIAGGKDAMFRAREGAEDHERSGADDVAGIDAGPLDIVCGLAASGRTPYVHGAIKEARRRGCKTIMVTTVPAEQVDLQVDIMIDVAVGPEVIMGSTRMKSATAQKMVLNMITTGAMIRLGKVYENIMVDLMLTNDKLKERAKRIIMFISGSDYREAEELLRRSDGHVKTALLMALTGYEKDRCERMLDENNGFIRRIIEFGK